MDRPGPDTRERAARRPLSDAELRGWFNLLNAHTHLTRQLDGELQAVHRITLGEHTVLRQLIMVGGHLRMSELADTVLLSPSGTSRLVDRLVAAGLIERQPCEQDGRAVHAAITELGRARAEEAEATYAEALHRLYVDRFSEEEYERFSDLLLRVAPACRRHHAGGGGA